MSSAAWLVIIEDKTLDTFSASSIRAETTLLLTLEIADTLKLEPKTNQWDASRKSKSMVKKRALVNQRLQPIATLHQSFHLFVLSTASGIAVISASFETATLDKSIYICSITFRCKLRCNIEGLNG